MNLSIPQRHQLTIARKTLYMSREGALIAGGMDHKQAVKFLESVGYSQDKIIMTLRRAAHSEADIKEFMRG